jgi:hypothetical protein
VNRRIVPDDLTPPDFVLPPTRFAQSAADALQCLIDTKRTQEQVIRLVQEGHRELGRYALLEDQTDWDDWRRMIAPMEPYFWPAHTADLVRAASDSYPLKAEEPIPLREVAERMQRGEKVPPPSYLPRLFRAFCVFSHPVLTMNYRGTDVALSALAWSVAYSTLEGALWLSLSGVHWANDGTAHLVFRSNGGTAAVWNNVRTQDRLDATFSSEVRTFAKWVCTAAMFLEQSIVVAHHAPIDRGARRRCEKLGQSPTCHVVQLRPELEADRASSTGEHSVEWSHRWMVRGHWRRQFFPSRQTNAPVWIHPHVKGPDDKPFVEPKPTVFAVTR